MEYSVRFKPIKLRELLGPLSDIRGSVIGMCFDTYVDVVCEISKSE
jgi:hypothetical protein